VHPAQQVRAVGDGQAGPVGHLERTQAGVEDVEDLLVAGLRQAVLAAVLGQRGVRDQGRHVVGAVRDKQRRRAGVHQVAVLDRPHATFEAAVDRARGVRVTEDVDVGGLGFLHGGPDLVR
jgi:hypothetical protein